MEPTLLLSAVNFPCRVMMFHLTARLGSLLKRIALYCRHNHVIKVYPCPSANGNSAHVWMSVGKRAILHTDLAMSIAAPLVRAIHAKSPNVRWMDDGSPPSGSVRDWPPSMAGSSPGVDQISHAFFLPCALQTDFFSCTAPVLSCWEIQAVLGISWGQVHLS
jgi:hypothetical protein